MDDLSLAVFTTKRVMHENEDIVSVHLDNDGFWSFFSDNDSNTSENAMVVSLGQIIDKDSSIVKLKDLPLGSQASRKSRQDPWIISK